MEEIEGISSDQIRSLEKKAWHITTATHNSRYSQRMFDNYVKLGESIWLSEKDETMIIKTVSDIVKKDNLNLVACNICGDHIHLLLVCEESELPRIVGKIKGVSARKYNIEKGITLAGSTRTRGHAPLSGNKKKKKKYNSLWTQKFGKRKISDDKDLRNVINYIRTNRQKHKLSKNIILERLIDEMCSSVEHAFRTEYK